MKLRILLAVLFGLTGVVLLCWLGVWQVQRLDWKQGILAEIEARIGAPPGVLPNQPDPDRDRYLPVRAHGRTGESEILIQSSHKTYGPGFRVITPFVIADGRRVLLDRGFILARDRDTDRPPLTMTVTGNLHWPDEIDMFTPEPDHETGLWFARDIPTLADALNTEPVLIVLRASDEDAPVILPLPVTADGIPNDHLQYAITWFLLAAVWAGMSIYLVITLMRRAEESQP
ncbi:MAG: SURF1 family protein [Qingshengfaniella sp.]